uniref:Uncharacterized protein n=1 Tax=Arundo donax TaxID=35708 RepID=A0A0A9FLA2_ARUDO
MCARTITPYSDPSPTLFYEQAHRGSSLIASEPNLLIWGRLHMVAAVRPTSLSPWSWFFLIDDQVQDLEDAGLLS